MAGVQKWSEATLYVEWVPTFFVVILMPKTAEAILVTDVYLPLK